MQHHDVPRRRYMMLSDRIVEETVNERSMHTQPANDSQQQPQIEYNNMANV